MMFRPVAVAVLALALALATGDRAAAHGGHGSRAPVLACAQHDLGEACAYRDPADARHVGTCRDLPGGLSCVRNRPVEPTPGPRLAAPWLGLGAAALGLTLLTRPPTRS